MPLTIIRIDIAKMHVDAIVNSTRRKPVMGYGTDAYLHSIAGPEMLKERQRYGFLKTSQAVITKGYGLPCNHVIHTIGPTYVDGNHHEAEDLERAYMNALNLAKKHQIKSIAFPLISSGAYRFPKRLALDIAFHSFRTFLKENEMDIYMVVYDDLSYALSKERFSHVKEYLGIHYFPEDNKTKTAKAVKPSLEQQLQSLDLPFSRQLLTLIRENGLDDVDVYKGANLTKQHFSKIRSNDDYRPKKETVLALCVSMRLSLEQTTQLLRSAGYAMSSSDRRDIIVRYCIEQSHHDIDEVNLMLFNLGEKPLA
jgi:O-acetyl-ADP-ribose deacetylase